MPSRSKQCQSEVTQGPAMPTYNQCVSLIQSSAAMLDQRAISNRSNCCHLATNSLSANVHDFDYEPQDDFEYEVNKNELSEDYEPIHNINTQFHELELYQAHQTHPFEKTGTTFQSISLDRETWHNLSQEDKAKWDTLSQGRKSRIIQGTCQRGLELGSSCTPVKGKTISKTDDIQDQQCCNGSLQHTGSTSQ